MQCMGRTAHSARRKSFPTDSAVNLTFAQTLLPCPEHFHTLLTQAHLSCAWISLGVIRCPHSRMDSSSDSECASSYPPDDCLHQGCSSEQHRVTDTSFQVTVPQITEDRHVPWSFCLQIKHFSLPSAVFPITIS